MKEFKDLEFEIHPIGNGLRAKMFFKNGYGVSVVRFKLMFGGYGSYTSNDKEWELAVIHGDENKFDIVYNTPITDDVLGHLSADDVSEIMAKVKCLPQKIK